MMRFNNQQGQTLVLFVLILPLIMGLAFYIIEELYIMNEQRKLKHIGDMVCDYALDNRSFTKQKELAIDNDSQIEKIEVNYLDDGIKVNLSKEVKSIFGRVLGYDTYSIKSRNRCVNEDKEG